MKKIACFLAVICSLAVSCSKVIDLPEKPQIAVTGIPEKGEVDIGEISYIKAGVSAPGGIASIVLGIYSPTLDEATLKAMGLETKFDLADSEYGKNAHKSFGLPYGDSIIDKKAVELDLTPFVERLRQAAAVTCVHKISVSVTDKSGQKFLVEISIRQDSAGIFKVESLDLWKRCAVVAVDMELPSGAEFLYREKNSSQWQKAVRTAKANEFSITPQWEENKNSAGLTVYTIKEGTGLKARTEYEFKLVENDTTLSQMGYSTEDGDDIPNSDFSGWYTKDGKDKGLIYPNAAPTTSPNGFWDSGNNAFSRFLCDYFEEGGEKGAELASSKAMNLLTPGNLTIGDFVFDNLEGSMNFGKHFNWTARPTAIKVRYSAQIGVIDCEKYKQGTIGTQDKGQIWFVVVDWKAQHTVVSGLKAPSGSLDPTSRTKTEEGDIVGYCTKDIYSTDGYTECTIPFFWYSKDIFPSKAKYNIAGSISNSCFGEYLVGCSSNRIRVTNVEFVY